MTETTSHWVCGAKMFKDTAQGEKREYSVDGLMCFVCFVMHR